MDHNYPFPETAITHGGIFHADDVFAFAFLWTINDSIRLVRTNHPSVRESDGNAVVFDIGGGEFDHHTPETVEERPFKDWMTHHEPYSSFGKIVRAYHDYVMSDDEYLRFDRRLCIPIDYADCNGGLWGNAPNTLSDVIASMNGNWDEDNSEKPHRARFLEAATFARGVITRTIDRIKAEGKAAAITENAIDVARIENHDHYVMLDRYTEFVPTFRKSGNESFAWVAYPSLRGGWQIYAPKIGGLNRDALTDDLINYIRIRWGNGVIFIHPAGFTASFVTRGIACEVLDHLQKTWNERNHPDPRSSRPYIQGVIVNGEVMS